jgi:hypothetical protein
LYDSAGATVPDPSRLLKRVRVSTSVQSLLDRPIVGDDDSTLSLALTLLLSVPVNTPTAITVAADLADSADLGTFQLGLGDSSRFDARDANTGGLLPVIYTTTPILGAPVTVQDQAAWMSVRGLPLLPSSAPVGETGLAAIGLVLSHPGTSQIAPIRCDSLTFQCRDQANQPLPPATLLDRVTIWEGASQVGQQTNLPGSGGEFTVSLTGIVLAPGDSLTLETRLDVEIDAPSTLFQMTVSEEGIYAHDENVGTRTAVSPDGEFPFTSGFTQLLSPASELRVGFEEFMPSVLVADGRAVSVARVTLSNAAPTASSDIVLDRLELRAADRTGNPLSIASAVANLQAFVEGSLWAESGALAGAESRAMLWALDPLIVHPGRPVDVEIHLTMSQETDLSSFQIGLESDGVGVVQPSSPLLSISVQPIEGQAFPFWTESGSFTGISLEESYSNFPNPFAAGRQETSFAFFLTRSAEVSLVLWSVRGKKVRTLLDRTPLGAGLHQETTWDGRNGRGDLVVNGVYLAEIQATLDDGSREKAMRKIAVVR